ncbi:MAG TPA: tryptophan synthase subunit alpha [Candidatus Baltobacteraceae bacterium]|jgi:tryptophan synthase alpha chain
MLEQVFERARGRGRSAFIPYVMAGDPDLATTGAILGALSDCGVDAIELGIPYGDPLADGPTIARAGVRALGNGVEIEDVFALVRSSLDRRGVPIVLFTYFNPVYQFGVDRFAREASAAGACAVIVPDIAFEEARELRATLATANVQMPLLVAPSTPIERAQAIAAQSGGFVYVVSRLGVTGAKTEPDFAPLRAQIAALRTVTSKPLAVGFGVSTPAHVAAVAPLADGIIVGSALIDAYAGFTGEEAARRARRFVEPLLEATQR